MATANINTKVLIAIDKQSVTKTNPYPKEWITRDFVPLPEPDKTNRIGPNTLDQQYMLKAYDIQQDDTEIDNYNPTGTDINIDLNDPNSTVIGTIGSNNVTFFKPLSSIKTILESSNSNYPLQWKTILSRNITTNNIIVLGRNYIQFSDNESTSQYLQYGDFVSITPRDLAISIYKRGEGAISSDGSDTKYLILIGEYTVIFAQRVYQYLKDLQHSTPVYFICSSNLSYFIDPIILETFALQTSQTPTLDLSTQANQDLFASAMAEVLANFEFSKRESLGIQYKGISYLSDVSQSSQLNNLITSSGYIPNSGNYEIPNSELSEMIRFTNVYSVFRYTPN